MEGAFIVAIVFGSIVLAIAIVGTTILMAIRIIKGGVSRKQQTQEAEETRLIQEMFQKLSRMEARIEALETILLDRQKGKNGDATN
jgi:phage shock protein B